MFLKELRLRNFRNYFELSLFFKKGVNILVGENAQGKTNLLEAIHFVNTLQSFRTQDEKNLINTSAGEAALSAVVEAGAGAKSISLFIDNKGKRAKVNNRKISRASEFLSETHVITFSPDDLFLIKDQPSERRRYFDRAILPHVPSYLKTINRYDKILHQRNHLLKDIQGRKNGAEKGLLTAWDDQLIEEGARLLVKRYDFAEEIKLFLEGIFKAISRSQKRLSIFYDSPIMPAMEGPLNTDEIKKQFRNSLEEAREEELRCGHTLIGPHRDDFAFILDDQGAKATFSQGQHRLAILALKLSEAALYKQRFSEHPILLLDDVFSELDEARGEALTAQIINMGIEQVFITAAKKEGIPLQTAGCSFYWIKEGTVAQYS